MKRILAFLMLLSSLPLLAASLEEVISRAEANSPDVRASYITYQNDLLAIERNALPDPEVWSASFEADPTYSENSVYGVSASDFTLSYSPDEDTSISVSAPFSVLYTGEEGSVYPGISASHTFDFGYDEDIYRNVQNEYSLVSAESSYQADLMRFRRSVVETIRMIYQTDEEIRAAKEEIDDIRTEIEESLILREISESSVEYLEMMLSLKRLEGEMEALTLERDAYAALFREIAGFSFEPLDEIPMPEIDFTMPDGNSATEMARLEAATALEYFNYENSLLNPSAITLSGGVDGAIYAVSSADDSISANAGLSYDADSWGLYMRGNGSWSLRDGSFIPSLTVGGYWSSDGSTESERIYLERLYNDYSVKSSSYRSALSDFAAEGRSYLQSVIAWKSSLSEQLAEIEYWEASAALNRAMLERGLLSSEDADDAESGLLSAQKALEILYLEGFELYYDLQIYML